jgi:hypothetical protein
VEANAAKAVEDKGADKADADKETVDRAVKTNHGQNLRS